MGPLAIKMKKGAILGMKLAGVMGAMALGTKLGGISSKTGQIAGDYSALPTRGFQEDWKTVGVSAVPTGAVQPIGSGVGQRNTAGGLLSGRHDTAQPGDLWRARRAGRVVELPTERAIRISREKIRQAELKYQ